MAKGSDNDFPSILFTEQSSAPATPAAGKRRIYWMTDNKFYVRDESGTETEIGAGGYTQGARVYNSGNLSINSGAQTALTFDSERYDTDTIHDAGTNPSRLTCKTTGKYVISGSIVWDSSTGGAIRQVSIVFGGSTYIAGQRGTNQAPSVLTVSTIYALEINEYVELLVFQDTGGALNILANGNNSPEFSMQRIG